MKKNSNKTVNNELESIYGRLDKINENSFGRHTTGLTIIRYVMKDNPDKTIVTEGKNLATALF